jgi:Flp pilus assembly protein TadD
MVKILRQADTGSVGEVAKKLVSVHPSSLAAKNLLGTALMGMGENDQGQLHIHAKRYAPAEQVFRKVLRWSTHKLLTAPFAC